MLPYPPENWLLNMSQHTTGPRARSGKGTLAITVENIHVVSYLPLSFLTTGPGVQQMLKSSLGGRKKARQEPNISVMLSGGFEAHLVFL